MQTQKIVQHSQSVLSSALACSILAAALVSTPIVADDAVAKPKTERCADVVKGGHNTCAVASLGISCQGNATEDNMQGAWVKVPAGTCTDIVNICAGRAQAPDDADAAKLERACGKIAEQGDGIAGGRIVDRNGVAI